ncbi:hypothetical protein LTR66_007674 [Elasticomyces elasticus]|nr:hypothetical protein LTR66_007674 [Elasticomyces elasticus]
MRLTSSAEESTRNTPLPPSTEKAYYRKCIELKRRINEVEEANDAARLRKERLNRSILKMRLERAFLLEHLAKRMQHHPDDSERSTSPPPTPADKPKRHKRPNRASPPAASSMASPTQNQPAFTSIPTNGHITPEASRTHSYPQGTAMQPPFPVQSNQQVHSAHTPLYQQTAIPSQPPALQHHASSSQTGCSPNGENAESLQEHTRVRYSAAVSANGERQDPADTGNSEAVQGNGELTAGFTAVNR